VNAVNSLCNNDDDAHDSEMNCLKNSGSHKLFHLRLRRGTAYPIACHGSQQRREFFKLPKFLSWRTPSSAKQASTNAVQTALLGNWVNTLVKFSAFLYTGMCSCCFPHFYTFLLASLFIHTWISMLHG
jgi:hypothetical protein